MPGRVGLRERIGAYLREHTGMTARRLDLYLSEHMPDLIVNHHLATRNELADIEQQFAVHEQDLMELEGWRDATRSTAAELTMRVVRLETKYRLPRRP